MSKEYYLYVNGQRVKVSEQIYKVYWREKEHEKYLEQVDKKNHLLFFSSLDHDGHFADSIIDESVDVEKIVETQMMIEAVRNAISRCLFLRKCTVVPEERIPLFRSKYTVRPEQDTACIILASASLLA